MPQKQAQREPLHVCSLKSGTGVRCARRAARDRDSEDAETHGGGAHLDLSLAFTPTQSDFDALVQKAGGHLVDAAFPYPSESLTILDGMRDLLDPSLSETTEAAPCLTATA